jgi:hypothetical protein
VFIRPLRAKEEDEEEEEDAASGLDDEAEELKEPEGSCRGAGRREGPMMTGWMPKCPALYKGDRVGEARVWLGGCVVRISASTVPSEDDVIDLRRR